MSRKESSTAERPHITFDQAMTSRFRLHGRTHHVSTCPVEVFQQLVCALMPPIKKGKEPGQKQKPFLHLIALLEDDADEMTRWYVIEELLARKVRIPFTKPDGQ